MKRRVRWVLMMGVFAFAAPASIGAQDAAAIWKSVSQPAFDAGKAANVSNLKLVRDRLNITLAEGHIQFAQPAAGAVFAAAFTGRGQLQVLPPNDLESQQLRLLIGKNSLEMEFTEAVFAFTDGTFEEIAGRVSWAPAGSSLGRLYQDRQQEREDVGAELLPRLFKGVLSADRKRTALFAADLKTKEKGWIHLRWDALDLEEVTVGRWGDLETTKHFDTWLSFPAGGRSSAEAYREPLAREDFQVAGYRIQAAVTGGEELRATAEVTLRHRHAGERVLLFHLDANLRVESVRDAQGGALPFFQPRDPKDRNQSYGDYVAVVLADPTRAEQSETLEFRYAGKRVIRKVGSGNYFCRSFGWYPTRPNSFASRTDFEITFKNPKRYLLVATGKKVSETTDGDTTISTWKSEIPLAVAGFAFGDYKLYTEKAGAVDIEIYANREPSDLFQGLVIGSSIPGGEEPSGRAALGTMSPSVMAKTMGIEVANTLRLFEKYFGPYPYSRLAVTNIPYSYSQGWPTLIYLSAISFLDSTQRNALGIRQHTLLTDFFRAHESSHQWWGHRVGWKSYHDQWLSEGFAQFSGNLYVLYRQNQKEYLNRLRQDKEELLGRDQRNRVYESLGPIWMGHRLATVDAPRGYATVIYNKGGLVLHMLRMLFFNPAVPNPEEGFMTMMQDFCKTFHNQAASTEDFKATVERNMPRTLDLDGNGSMDWFFRQYVYGTGIPQYQFRYAVQEEGGKWKVTGSVTQSGVAEGWKDLLPMYVQTSGRVVRVGTPRAVQKETPFEFTLPMKPEKLTLNYNEDVLAHIRQ